MTETQQAWSDARHQRREALSRDPSRIGIDFVEAARQEGRLILHFVPPADEVKAKMEILRTIVPDNIQILDASGVAGPADNVKSVSRKDSEKLAIELEQAEASTSAGAQTKTLQLRNVPNVDPFFSSIAFTFEIDEPARFDIIAGPAAESLPTLIPETDYLAKDYASFRKLMLDRLSLLIPEWTERNPADFGIAVVEAIAHAADQLSYFQDAVATEAYLGTARNRTSVRRHARLLDYFMHDGCNARAWLHFSVADGAEQVPLPQGTPVLSRLAQSRPRFSSEEYEQILAEQPTVFETMHFAWLYPGHNEMRFYTWGAREFFLRKGTTSATLEGSFPALKAGDVLIFEEVRSPSTGAARDADPGHRHPVRLTRVYASSDPLGNQILDPEDTTAKLVTEIEWEAGDALPFSLQISTTQGGAGLKNLGVARGNVVLADHGRTRKDAAIHPGEVSPGATYRPKLQHKNITHSVGVGEDSQPRSPATRAVVQAPKFALPMVSLMDRVTGETWKPRRDLLRSDRFSREFVLEIEADGQAQLRFGDGNLGKVPAPGTQFIATYRVGNGVSGNVGQDTLVHVVSDEIGITGVRNPMTSTGGIDLEPAEQVSLNAPESFYTQERAITEQDYAAAAERHPDVQRAAAKLAWTGSWHTMYVAVDGKGGRSVDETFRAEIREFVDPYRLAGYDLEVLPPRFVSLDFAFVVHVEAYSFRDTVKQALTEAFSNVEFPDGRRGLFHPDSLTFGQSIYLSAFIAAIMQVPGVSSVDLGDARTRFYEMGRPNPTPLSVGQLHVSPVEIPRLDNDPKLPANGQAQFFLEGGL